MSVDKSGEYISEQESGPLDDEGLRPENMQMQLQTKGAVLSQAWSDLFGFITRYQAELVLKENTVEIAEKEIQMRKKQLEEMKPVVDAGNEDVSRLQEEIHVHKAELRKAQSELSVKELILRRVQADLTSNVGLLEKSRTEVTDKENDLLLSKIDVERLKSELNVKEEQILIKDNLLKKLQNQLMKENSELKEQLDIERRALQLEKQSHELTKRTMMSSSEKRKRARKSTTAVSSVIEIPDSPPTLDLSNEREDYGLSNIISLAETQTRSSQIMERNSQARTRASKTVTSASQDLVAGNSSHLQHQPTSDNTPLTYKTPEKGSSFPAKFLSSPCDDINQTAMTTSDTFFPLSVDDSKPSVDSFKSSVQIDTDFQDSTLSHMKPGTPSSTTSDNEGPVPVSGPIPSPAMSQGGSIESGSDGKNYPMLGGPFEDLKPGFSRCLICGKTIRDKYRLSQHLRIHTGEKPFACSLCDKTFRLKQQLNDHHRIHTGERPFKCDICGKAYNDRSNLKKHKVIHLNAGF